jgi:hypothetical protein
VLILIFDSLAFIISNPEALRSAVLMAGIHFAFNVGSLSKFEPTFLYHKIETVQLVRKWVSRRDPKLVAGITKQISTLAYAEVRDPLSKSEELLLKDLGLSR